MEYCPCCGLTPDMHDDHACWFRWDGEAFIPEESVEEWYYSELDSMFDPFYPNSGEE